MKTNHTDEEIQVAIDAACEETHKNHPKTCGQLVLVKKYYPSGWPAEKPARLHLLKSALDHLPEPLPPVVDGKTPEQLLFNLLHPGSAWIMSSDKYKAELEAIASAVLAAFGNKPASQPLPISTLAQDQVQATPEMQATAEAVLLEEMSQPADTFIAHGKTWTHHTPGDTMPCDGEAMVYILCDGSKSEKDWGAIRTAGVLNWSNEPTGDWQIQGWRYADEPTPVKPVTPGAPAVGDVVMLKSGGPKMTVTDFAITGLVVCHYFDSTGKLCPSYFPAATLTPA